MPDEPQSYDELVDALREHPEWRHNLRELLGDDSEPGDGPPPPKRNRLAGWLPTLGMGVLIGAIVAGVAAFVLLNDDDDDTPAEAAGLGSPTASPAASETASSPSPRPSSSPNASPTGSASAEAATPTPSPTSTPTQAPQPTPTTQPQPQPTQPPATPSATQAPSGPAQFTFGGFEGACAPVSAVVSISNVTQPITMTASWTGPTLINVAPLTIAPPGAPGAVVTVRFPTVAPLTPGIYTFAANADGVPVASGSLSITC